MTKKFYHYEHYDADGELVYLGRGKLADNRIRAFEPKGRNTFHRKAMVSGEIQRIEITEWFEDEESCLLSERQKTLKFTPKFNLLGNRQNQGFRHGPKRGKTPYSTDPLPGHTTWCPIQKRVFYTPKRKNRFKLTPDQEYLRAYYDYDPEGFLLGTEQAYKRIRGVRCGWKCKSSGYWRLNFRSQNYFLHRVIFKWHHGEDFNEELELDHINGNKDDNRIENLRTADRRSNLANTDSFTGGVSKAHAGKYKAGANFLGDYYHLGTFDTPEEGRAVDEEFWKDAEGWIRKNVKSQ